MDAEYICGYGSDDGVDTYYGGRAEIDEISGLSLESSNHCRHFTQEELQTQQLEKERKAKVYNWMLRKYNKSFAVVFRSIHTPAEQESLSFMSDVHKGDVDWPLKCKIDGILRNMGILHPSEIKDLYE